MLLSRRRKRLSPVKLLVYGFLAAIAFLIWDNLREPDDEQEPLPMTSTQIAQLPTVTTEAPNTLSTAQPTEQRTVQPTIQQSEQITTRPTRLAQDTVIARPTETAGPTVDSRLPATAVTRRPSPTPRPRPTIIATRVPASDPRLASVARAPTAVNSGTSLFIPTAGISANVIDVYINGQTWNLAYLGANAGHLQGTSRIGEPGNVVLAGHVETTTGGRGPFATLDEVPVGTVIILSQGEEEWRYVVRENLVTDPLDITVLLPSENDRLTLITCGAYDLFADLYEERIVVIADRIA